MDNLSVHKTKIVRELFDDKFVQMFLPPQSCELNPIEKVWNIIKTRWRKTSYMILENNRKTDEKVDDAVRMIQGIAEGIDQEMMKKWAESLKKEADKQKAVPKSTSVPRTKSAPPAEDKSAEPTNKQECATLLAEAATRAQTKSNGKKK